VTAACDFATRVQELWSDAEPSYDALRQRARAVKASCRS
jgi:hypothetical protein